MQINKCYISSTGLIKSQLRTCTPLPTPLPSQPRLSKVPGSTIAEVEIVSYFISGRISVVQTRLIQSPNMVDLIVDQSGSSDAVSYRRVKHTAMALQT
jgi:hypothetical protein